MYRLDPAFVRELVLRSLTDRSRDVRDEAVWTARGRRIIEIADHIRSMPTSDRQALGGDGVAPSIERGWRIENSGPGWYDIWVDTPRSTSCISMEADVAEAPGFEAVAQAMADEEWQKDAEKRHYEDKLQDLQDSYDKWVPRPDPFEVPS